MLAAPPTVAPSSDVDDTSLDFGVAICAEQDTFGHLCPEHLQRPRQSALTNAEFFRLGIAVVKLRRSDVPVVSADVAPAARLGNEDLLESPPTTRNRFGAAPQAPVDTAIVEPKVGDAVATALAPLPGCVHATHTVRIRSPGPPRAQAMTAEPVPHRRLAETEPLGNLARSESSVYERRERLLVDAALRCMTVAIDRRQPVALHPVSDRRRMACGQLADPVDREALAQISL